MPTPKPLRRVVQFLTRERWASVLQLVALGIGVALVYHYFDFWPALGAAAIALVLVSLGLDPSDRSGK